MNLEKISTVLSVLGGLVGLIGGISSFLSAQEAKVEVCEAKRDSLVLAVNANVEQEAYLAFKANLLLNDVQNSAEATPKVKGTGEWQDIVKGLTGLSKIEQNNKRSFNAEQLDKIECSEENSKKFTKMLRNEQSIKETLTNKGWDEIFRRAETLLRLRSSAT
jgi:hypothetical protein